MQIDRIPVDGGTRAPSGDTACYILGSTSALLVDPAARDDAIDDRIDEIDHVAVTHHHGDHVGAVAHYAAATDATIWCRYGRTEQFRDATGVDADRTFRAGTSIPTDEEPAVVVETPGHAPEHVAFAIDDGLVSGDVAVAEGSVVVAAPHGDMRAYLTSLRRLWVRDPARLLAAHGPVVEDVRGTCERLLLHRRERERRVLAAVEGGNQTVDAILDSAYEKDLTGVRDLAGATVRAHLEKLAHESRLRWDGAHAEPV